MNMEQGLNIIKRVKPKKFGTKPSPMSLRSLRFSRDVTRDPESNPGSPVRSVVPKFQVDIVSK
jgi:hypothetical protein